jgi:glycerol-3-phosphate dehydrogenase
VSEFDLIVIGGGINGLWSALTARHQGLKVALYEKNDFASGTSGKSTQLIHGGLRYLEHGELKLVYESLHERTWLLKNLPQLVKPLMFYIPVFKRKPFLGIKYFIGLLLYYILSGGRGTFPKWVSPQKLKKENPNLETDFLLGALEYFDAQTNDRALCRFLAEECAKQGVSIFKEHEVVSIQKEPNGFSIEVLDRTKQKAMTVSAKVVLSAKGPWEDKKYLRPTKGVHLFFEKFTGEHGYLLSATDDRVFFVLPYEDKTLVGTTDTNYLGSPDEVKTEEADRNYLIEQTGRYFKNIKNVKRLGDYAGIRPLMNSGAETNAKASRRDFLIESETGHYHMIGGKLTTGRAFATRAIKKILSNHFKDKKFQKISWGFEK